MSEVYWMDTCAGQLLAFLFGIVLILGAGGTDVRADSVQNLPSWAEPGSEQIDTRNSNSSSFKGGKRNRVGTHAPNCSKPNPPSPCNEDGQFCPGGNCSNGPPVDAPIDPIGGVLLILSGGGYAVRKLQFAN